MTAPTPGAKALGQVDPDAVHTLGVTGRRDSGRHHRVQQAGSVHVGQETRAVGYIRHLIDNLEGPDRPAGQVGGLLYRYQPGGGHVTGTRAGWPEQPAHP